MLESSQQRDVIQSYATNLARLQGQAGMRLDIPDFLRGIFRLFESHAAALRTKYGSLKRAICFDDVDLSLYMDVKLEQTDWVRISTEEMRDINQRSKNTTSNALPATAASAADKRKVLMLREELTDVSRNYPHIESDNESASGSASARC